jgi:predicted HNH restriction endonuclease
MQKFSPLTDAIISVEPTFTAAERKFLAKLVSFKNCSASSTEMQAALDFSDPLVANGSIGRIGRKVLKAYGSHPDGWPPGTFEFWTVTANGRPVNDRGFVWTLKPEVVEGLRASGYAVFVEEISGHDEHNAFSLELQSKPTTHLEVIRQLEIGIAESLAGSRDARLKRLLGVKRVPEKVSIVSTVFLRNPDVVAEALFQANGICQRCQMPAPFTRASDGAPYLEVHHKIPLSAGGEDSVANTLALCPNCHRNAHYGENQAQCKKDKN